jgi:hypothetical protein
MKETPSWYKYWGAVAGILFFPLLLIYWIGSGIIFINMYVNGFWDSYDK